MSYYLPDQTYERIYVLDSSFSKIKINDCSDKPLFFLTNENLINQTLTEI